MPNLDAAADTKSKSLKTLKTSSSILSCCNSGLISAIGSGSNGVVLSSTFTRQPPSRRIPLHRKLALKVMSHFWDASARLLLDCERKTLAFLPPHPSIIRVFEEFEESLPQEIIRFLTPAMQQAATSVSSDTQSIKNQTQFFVMEFHPSTLDNWRSVWPAPMPWHILHRISQELLSVAVHMQKHGVGHLDLKLDNILVGYDGRSTLTDFGISRVFDEESKMMLQYKEPFGLLMNRLVLAPEVLADYDRATQVWKRLTSTLLSRTRSSSSGVSNNSGSSSSGGAAAFPQENLSPQDKKDLTIGFNSQCVWSIGVVLYELACSFNHEPTYPEDGGGMRGASYALNTLVPLPALPAVGPNASLEQRGFRTAKDGSLRRIDISGYPSAFCGLVFSMLDANPQKRVTVEGAFISIQAMKPFYAVPSLIQTHQEPAAITLPDGTILRLSHEVSCVEKDHSDGQSMLVLDEHISPDGLEVSPSNTPLVPVLLRHWSGSCRLVRVTADLSVHQVAVCWSVGLQISISSQNEGSRSKDLVEASEPSEDAIALCRIFLGGFEAQGNRPISDLVELLQPLDQAQPQSVSLIPEAISTTSDVDEERWSDDEGDSATATSRVAKPAAPPNPPARILTKHFIHKSLESNGGILVLDLVPSEAETTNLSAKHVLTLLDEICGGSHSTSPLSKWKMPAPLFLQGDDSSSPLPISTTTNTSPSASPNNENLNILKPFENFANDHGRLGPLSLSISASASKRALSTPNNTTCALVDMREAFIYRSLLTLTGLSNSALRHPNSPFPYQECSRYSVLATLWYPTNHDTVAAAVGVLRNVSCTESLATATSMVDFGAVRACASAYFQTWKTAAEIDSSRRSGENNHDSSASNSSTFVTINSLPVSNAKFHGRDVRCAEDCILGASNFLRFDELQVHSINVPTFTLALMCSDAMDSFPKDQSMQNSATTLMRYMLSMDEPDNGPRSAGLPQLVDRKELTVVEALVRAGCMRGLSQAMKQFPADRSIIENALHIVCTLLVFDEYRTTSLCPYKLCAEAVIAVMNRQEMADNTHVLNLGASALRNLACVTDDNINSTESPAIMVTQAGAATVLEDVMAKHPNLASLQENGRCALYNLLLLGAKDAMSLSHRTVLAEVSKAELQSRLIAAEAQLKSQSEVELESVSGHPPLPVRKDVTGLPSGANHLHPTRAPVDVVEERTITSPNVADDPHTIVTVNEWSAAKPSRKDKTSSQPTNNSSSRTTSAVTREVLESWESERLRLIRILIIASIMLFFSLSAVIGLAVTWRK